MKKVLVAMSGGVDSSTTAALLKKQGYFIIGITMQLWSKELREEVKGCCGLGAILDAKKVANILKIPHYTLNFREIFKEKVIRNFYSEYKNGRTPNPCLRCNQFVKFDFLLKKAKLLNCDFLATGHYAKIEFDKKRKKYLLKKAKDKNKDQSYFLYTLTQGQMKNILFPLGDFRKEEVRKLAKKIKLPVFEKPESQEICFIPGNDYRKYLKEKYPSLVKEGLILDKKGRILGRHEGIAFYTIGQRKGLRIAAKKPFYVVKIDVKNNRLIVGKEKDLYSKKLIAKDVNWISGKNPKLPLRIKSKIRSRHKEASATIYYLKSNIYHLIFKEPQRAITSGQSVVFYKGQEVLGGGIIY